MKNKNRVNYHNEKVQEDLYQYEMGMELGADLEFDKQQQKQRNNDLLRNDQMNQNRQQQNNKR